MKVLLFLVVAALVCCTSVLGDNYAVLVAGSNGYYNYRHQSDVCHAFQVLTKDGNIPAENIIVMMYDDIANNAQNPTPGVLLNHPNGTDVYAGVNKDYTGDDVNPANFLAILTGNKTGVTGGNGRVLESTANDNVFVYFSDHGATGLIAFPNDYLYAADLLGALKTMNANNMYKQLVFYLEACESGSMFSGLLPANVNIYATTASTPDQSSYACYWDPVRQAYLGDEYSVRWMEDADVHDKADSQWTLEEQFKVVASETVQSQPQQYGQLSIDEESINEFEGLAQEDASAEEDQTSLDSLRQWITLLRGRMDRKDKAKLTAHGSAPSVPTRPVLKYTPCGSQASSRDVKLKTLLHMRQSALANGATSDELDLAIQTELQSRASADFVFDEIMMRVAGDAVEKEHLKRRRYAPRKFPCIKAAVSGVEANCGKLTDYSLKYVYLLVNACERGARAEQIIEAARDVCVKEAL